MYKMKTVKEWAEEAGIDLINYDGYTTAYEVVSGIERNGFTESQALRFRDAGYLYCTRKAFSYGLNYCTMNMPKIEDYDKISEVLPEYVEKHIGIHISFLIREIQNQDLNNDKLKENLQRLLELLYKKKDYRTKGINMNENEKTVIEENNDKYSSIQKIYAKIYNQTTVEGLEECLLNNVVSSLEAEVQSKEIKKEDLESVFDEIELLDSLNYQASRNRGGFDIKNTEDVKENIESFGYAPILEEMGKETVIKTFKMYGPDSAEPGVMYFAPKIKAAMSLSEELADKINDNLAKKENYDSPEKKDKIEDETDQALQLIDREIKPEERKTFLTRIKQFYNKFVSNINSKKEKDERD